MQSTAQINYGHSLNILQVCDERFVDMTTSVWVDGCTRSLQRALRDAVVQDSSRAADVIDIPDDHVAQISRL